MKKIFFGVTIISLSMLLASCGQTEKNEETQTASSTIIQNTEVSSVEISNEEQELEEKLEEKGVEIRRVGNFIELTREKSIDYDYFTMDFVMSSNTSEVLQIQLVLRGNIDGEDKDALHYRVSSGRIVEFSGRNTDIQALAELLESLDCSDQELLKLVVWYYDNN
ncbi:hypothetical protein I6N96_02290 [Enterococcus sp. BWM-S5]|uniref:Lipoprotein n=1 Tax=Enterococcus larvae TaxID=2794352 RepID=A0ABS4CEY5_9ENTE|nr:hypothetical protein [Enterococcus larvae]MBP1045092.1 hypothetical protein [Enterococcus larvae]